MKYCGKMKFWAKADALQEIKKQHLFHKNQSCKSGRKKRVYLCGKCGAWHITTLSPSAVRQFARMTKNTARSVGGGGA